MPAKHKRTKKQSKKLPEVSSCNDICTFQDPTTKIICDQEQMYGKVYCALHEQYFVEQLMGSFANSLSHNSHPVDIAEPDSVNTIDELVNQTEPKKSLFQEQNNFRTKLMHADILYSRCSVATQTMGYPCKIPIDDNYDKFSFWIVQTALLDDGFSVTVAKIPGTHKLYLCIDKS